MCPNLQLIHGRADKTYGGGGEGGGGKKEKAIAEERKKILRETREHMQKGMFVQRQKNFLRESYYDFPFFCVCFFNL